jgi:hypothetical protein
LDALAAFHQVAVAGNNGKAILHESTENWGHTISGDGGPFNILTGVQTEVPMISLETALNLFPAREKFNIEGAEFDLVQQASLNALHRVSAMVGEVHYDLGSGDFSPSMEKLRNAGFSGELLPAGEFRAILVARRNSPY